MHIFKCKNCDIEFISANKNRIFCSPSCSSIWNNKQRKGYRNIQVFCSYCGKYILMRKCEYKKHIKRNLKNFYCSKKCMGLDKKNDKRPHTSKSLLNAYKTEKLSANKQNIEMEDIGKILINILEVLGRLILQEF